MATKAKSTPSTTVGKSILRPEAHAELRGTSMTAEHRAYRP
jgi:hypothetical protein